MTEFIIQRMAHFREAVHGRLYIHGEYVCDTLERAAQCLPAGSYSLLQYRRDWHPQKVGVEQLIRFVASDGCYALQCGEIAIGEWKYLGFLIHSRDIFDTLQERVRRLTSRHQVITVIIREDGDGDFFCIVNRLLDYKSWQFVVFFLILHHVIRHNGSTVTESYQNNRNQKERRMMKYLLFSDIHGCLPALERALDFYEAQKCDMMCIMGDIINYGPRNRIPEGIDPKGIVERLNGLADQIIAVRGNCDAEVDQMLLDFPIMETYALLVDDGKRYLLTHGHIYNKENMPKGPYDAIIYGHSHLWELSHSDRAICNTGSITFPKGGNPPTIATLEDGKFTMYNLDTLEVMATMEV